MGRKNEGMEEYERGKENRGELRERGTPVIIKTLNAFVYSAVSLSIRLSCNWDRASTNECITSASMQQVQVSRP